MSNIKNLASLKVSIRGASRILRDLDSEMAQDRKKGASGKYPCCEALKQKSNKRFHRSLSIERTESCTAFISALDEVEEINDLRLKCAIVMHYLFRAKWNDIAAILSGNATGAEIQKACYRFLALSSKSGVRV
jgi:hypothetical protein